MTEIVLQNTTTGTTFRALFKNTEAAVDFLIGDKSNGYVLMDADNDVLSDLQAWDERDVVYCSLCDGQGHGQPGFGPCPLEDRGWMDTAEEEARLLGMF